MRKSHSALLVFAALVMAAFAAPAAASATYWWQEGEPFEEAAELELHGSYSRSGPVFGMQCGDVDAQALIGPGDLGEVTSISFSACKGTGAMAGYNLKVTPEDLPWAFEADGAAGTVTIPTVHFTAENEFGQWKEWLSHDAYWELTPDNAYAIQSFQVAGATVTGMAEKGQFAVTPAGQYGFSE